MVECIELNNFLPEPLRVSCPPTELVSLSKMVWIFYKQGYFHVYLSIDTYAKQSLKQMFTWMHWRSFCPMLEAVRWKILDKMGKLCIHLSVVTTCWTGQCGAWTCLGWWIWQIGHHQCHVREGGLYGWSNHIRMFLLCESHLASIFILLRRLCFYLEVPFYLIHNIITIYKTIQGSELTYTGGFSIEK